MTESVGTKPDSKTIPPPLFVISILLVVAVAPKLKYISVSEMFWMSRYWRDVLEANACALVLGVAEVVPVVTVTAEFLGRTGSGVPPEIP